MHQHVKMPNLDPNIPLPFTFVTILADKISFTDFIPKVNEWFDNRNIYFYFNDNSMIPIFDCPGMQVGLENPQ